MGLIMMMTMMVVSRKAVVRRKSGLYVMVLPKSEL